MSNISALLFVLLTKPLAPGICFSISQIFVLETAVVAKPLVSGILFSTLLSFVFKTVFVTKRLMFFYQHLQSFCPSFA